MIRALLALVCLAVAASAVGADVRIPETSALYRIQVQRALASYWGLDADKHVARYAAQLHQESAWRADARSPYAIGLAQFTPATARWLPDICPELGTFDPWDPGQSIRAGACYMHWLQRRVRVLEPAQAGGLNACSRWVFALRAYNGGESWVNRERRAAAAQGRDPNAWRDVEPVRLRAVWAHRENTHYPRRVLLVLEPAYVAAGWPGRPVCH